VSDPLNVVFTAAEAVPFIKAGGLADIAGTLPDRLVELGHEVSLFLPFYGDIDGGKYPVRTIFTARVPFFSEMAECNFRLQNWVSPSGLQVYFIDAPTYFQRKGLYSDPVTGKPFSDEGERFLFFSLAVLESLDRLDRNVDLIHCNDYHSAMIPALLKRHYSFKPALADTATVFSIHNLAYQGVYGKELLRNAGVQPAEFRPGSPFEFWGKLNFMKVGIGFADMISTVSRQYAEEITGNPEYGCGLEGALLEREADLLGIVNGIDTETWSPVSDPLIEVNYSLDDLMSGKEVNKIALLKECGLVYRPETPLIGMISRLVNQKGFDLFSPIIKRLMSLKFQLVILGTGQLEVEAQLAKFAEEYPEQIVLLKKFDNRLAHRIEAGSDFFLMPSRYEPCGLNQMYSMRYGTVPIVRFTGGLADTVLDANIEPLKGRGFGFTDYEPEAMLDAVSRAVAFYRRKDQMLELRQRIMQLDFSWKKSAESYEHLYRAAILKKNGELGEKALILGELRAIR
jgi:starch synthase